MFEFQVLVPSAGIRGFLDASEYGTWLKHFQSAQDEAKQNVKHLLIAGQVSQVPLPGFDLIKTFLAQHCAMLILKRLFKVT